MTFSRQFRVADTVMIDNQYGTIEDITPSHTIIKLWDWRRLIMPNSVMLNKEVINYSTHDSFIWASLEFHVAYDSDLDVVRETAIALARRSRYFVGSENPRLWIRQMNRDSVKCWLAMWTKSPVDAWSIKMEVAEGLIREFRRKGIRTHLFLHHSFQPSEDTPAFDQEE
ncbi:MAG: mechanosensitive ion channel family protein [Opitutales bacterium]